MKTIFVLVGQIGQYDDYEEVLILSSLDRGMIETFRMQITENLNFIFDFKNRLKKAVNHWLIDNEEPIKPTRPIYKRDKKENRFYKEDFLPYEKRLLEWEKSSNSWNIRKKQFINSVKETVIEFIIPNELIDISYGGKSINLNDFLYDHTDLDLLIKEIPLIE